MIPTTGFGDASFMVVACFNLVIEKLMIPTPRQRKMSAIITIVSIS